MPSAKEMQSYLMKMLSPQSAQASDMPSAEDMAFQISQSPDIQSLAPETQESINNAVVQEEPVPQMSGLPISSMSMSMPVGEMSPENKKMQAEYNELLKSQFQKQEGGLDQQKELLSMLAQSPTATDYTPLAGFYQQLTGKALPYQAPKNISGTDLYGQFGGIQKGEQELTKNKIDALKSMLSSSNDNAAMRLALQQQRNSQYDDRQDRGDHNRTLTFLKNNKDVSEQIKNFQTLDGAMGLLFKKKEITPQDIHEFQQAIRKALNISGSSGVGEREETYLKSLGLNSEAFKQFLTGVPSKISKSDPFVQHLKHIAQGQQGLIQGRMDDVLNDATEGHASMYARRPDLKEDLMRAVKARKARVETSKGSEAATEGSFVRVSNGKETLEIPIEDLEAAKADGFRRAY